MPAIQDGTPHKSLSQPICEILTGPGALGGWSAGSEDLPFEARVLPTETKAAGSKCGGLRYPLANWNPVAARNGAG